MTQQSIGSLPHQFGEDFVRYYEKYLVEFKRLDNAANTRKAKKIKQPVPVLRDDQEEPVDQTEEASYTDQF
jgi:hypothetical protein